MTPMALNILFPGHVKDAVVQSFMAKGWEEVGFLGSGARGPVLQVRRRAGSAGCHCDKQYALKRSTYEEVHALQALSSCRNILQLEEHFAGSGINEVWTRLELLEGGTLRNYLRDHRSTRVAEETVRYLLREVLHGLEDMHSKSWMHRDVKAENIGLSGKPSQGGRVKILDFDTAARIRTGSHLTEVIGTVENMAPEVYQGRYSELADCWSLGVVAYELLFGYRPFNDANIDMVEEMIRNWQKYLLIPSDTADGPQNFIKTLLVGQQERMSSATAAKHHWLVNCGRGLPTSKAAIDLMRSPASASGTTQHMPLLLQSSGKEVIAATPSPKKKAGEDCSGACPATPGSDLDSLSRLRRSLDEWNMNYSSVSGQHEVPVGGHARPLESVPTALHRLSQPTSPAKSTPPAARSMRSGNHGPLADAPSKVAGRASSVAPAPAAGTSSPLSLPDAGDQWHLSYLKNMRAKTQEMLNAYSMAKRSSEQQPQRLQQPDALGQKHQQDPGRAAAPAAAAAAAQSAAVSATANAPTSRGDGHASEGDLAAVLPRTSRSQGLQDDVAHRAASASRHTAKLTEAEPVQEDPFVSATLACRRAKELMHQAAMQAAAASALQPSPVLAAPVAPQPTPVAQQLSGQPQQRLSGADAPETLAAGGRSAGPRESTVGSHSATAARGSSSSPKRGVRSSTVSTPPIAAPFLSHIAGLSGTSNCSTDAPAASPSPGDDTQLEHLQDVRARTQELLRRLTSASATARAAAAVAAASAVVSPSSSSPPLPASSSSSADDDEACRSRAPVVLPPGVVNSGTPLDSSFGNRVASPAKLAPEASSPKSSSSSTATTTTRASLISESAASAASGSSSARGGTARAGGSPAVGPAAPAVLEWVDGAGASGCGARVSSPSGASPTRSVSDASVRSPSPQSWLISQRQRTEKLLGRMRRASVELSAGRCRPPTCGSTGAVAPTHPSPAVAGAAGVQPSFLLRAPSASPASPSQNGPVASAAADFGTGSVAACLSAAGGSRTTAPVSLNCGQQVAPDGQLMIGLRAGSPLA